MSTTNKKPFSASVNAKQKTTEDVSIFTASVNTLQKTIEDVSIFTASVNTKDHKKIFTATTL